MLVKLIEKADFLKNVLDVIPSLLFVVDDDVRIYHLNAAAVRFLQVDKEAALLKRGGDVIRCIHSLKTPHEGCGRTAHCGDCIVRNSVNKAFQGEQVLRKTTKMALWNDGRISDRHFMVTAGRLRHEERDFVLLIMEDVTNLQIISEKLERRSAQLEAMNRELETFTYSASHDLKAPLQSISGFSEVLMETCAPRLDEKSREYLARIHNSSVRMNEFIDDMLSFARASQCELDRESVDLSRIAKEVADEALVSNSGRSMEFFIQPGLRAFCNDPLAHILLYNLISNAVKYTSTHPSARIEFGMMAQRGRRVYFVRDDGCGFDMTFAGDIFTPFKRLHNSFSIPGTGIGLATVDRIIQRHGGRVWAESAVEKGATFYFTLEPAGH